ncbi:MAG: nucleotidyltransferase domain-containing protein [Methanoregula sp.]|jgi:predicted nucleotidyltransferase
MVDAKVLETVNYFSTRIRESGIRIDNLILFGSSSTGTARPGSDIDIAIISDDFLGRDIFDRALLTRDAELTTIRKFRVPLDIITLTTEELADPASPIAGVLRKGIDLFQASSA